MRYDGLLRAIERANARFEAEIQGILRQYAKSDGDTATALLAGLAKPTLKKARKKYERKMLHWTQRPENKARLKKQLAKATKASKAVKHGAV